MVRINGVDTACDGVTLLLQLEQSGFNVNRIALEYNGTIVKRSEWEHIMLQDGDRLEVVSFVGGG